MKTAISVTNDLDTKARILEAAGTVFAQKGFESATVREICQLAGANLAAINYHFGDKQRLYVEVIKRAHTARSAQAPLPFWQPNTSAEQKLRDFIGMLLNRMLAESAASWHHEVLLREVARPSGACEEMVGAFIRPQFELLQSILRELLPQDTPERTRHMIAFSIVGQCMHYRVAAPIIRLLVSPDEYRTYRTELLADHIASLTLAALGRRPPLAQRSEGAV